MYVHVRACVRACVCVCVRERKRGNAREGVGGEMHVGLCESLKNKQKTWWFGEECPVKTNI